MDVDSYINGAIQRIDSIVGVEYQVLISESITALTLNKQKRELKTQTAIQEMEDEIRKVQAATEHCTKSVADSEPVVNDLQRMLMDGESELNALYNDYEIYDRQAAEARKQLADLETEFENLNESNRVQQSAFRDTLGLSVKQNPKDTDLIEVNINLSKTLSNAQVTILCRKDKKRKGMNVIVDGVLPKVDGIEINEKALTNGSMKLPEFTARIRELRKDSM